MVKGKKATSKKGNDAVAEVDNKLEDVEAENSSQENGLEDAPSKKKSKGKDKNPEENSTEREENGEVVENGDERENSDPKKATAKPKKSTKKDTKSEEETEKEETNDVVENGEEKSEKKKSPAKPKKVAKKESKPQVEPARKSSRTPKPVTKEGDSEASYEVEKIIDSRVVGKQTEYLVRWKGYSKGDDTWEDEADLNCPELLQKFKAENSGTTKKAKKRPSKSPAKSPAAKKAKKVEKAYEVEEIVGLRIKNGKKEFKIRWKGYKESDDSWEPEKHLSCQDLIQKYVKEHEDEVQDVQKKKTTKKVKKAKSPKARGKNTKTK